MITGASGAIGTALARAYAAPDTTLLLLGRDPARLQRAAREAEVRGARVHTSSVDLRDRERTIETLRRLDAAHPVDLLIANAGVMHAPAARVERWQDVAAMLAVNVDACLATVVTLAERMLARGRGQIAIMSSLAALRGLPAAPGYSASKAAVNAYGEALRGRLAGTGVRVSVVCPGVIDSPMGDAFPGHKPVVYSPERAARLIRRGLARDRARIAFPAPMALGLDLLALLPVGLGNALLARLFGRQ